MANKPLKRIHRSVPLTPEQAASDRELRQEIREEFPPLKRREPSPVLSEPLRQAIVDSKKTAAQLAKEAGVPEIVLRRFLAGEADLRLAAADQLAGVLGLRLVEA